MFRKNDEVEVFLVNRQKWKSARIVRCIWMATIPEGHRFYAYDVDMNVPTVGGVGGPAGSVLERIEEKFIRFPGRPARFWSGAMKKGAN
jgi:hypothetical protein